MAYRQTTMYEEERMQNNFAEDSSLVTKHFNALDFSKLQHDIIHPKLITQAC